MNKSNQNPNQTKINHRWREVSPFLRAKPGKQNPEITSTQITQLIFS